MGNLRAGHDYLNIEGKDGTIESSIGFRLTLDQRSISLMLKHCIEDWLFWIYLDALLLGSRPHIRVVDRHIGYALIHTIRLGFG